jgi:hypothetical protein
MPLRYEQIRGRPVGLYMRLLAPGVTTAPTPVTVTVAAAGAAAGANVIPVTALPAAIPKNTVLVFDRAAGNPDTLTVVVTEDAAEAATSINVEMFEGEEGAGLTHALADGDDANWDGLYTVAGTENSPYTNNPQTQELNAVTYGAATGVSVSTPEITSISPQIARTGLFVAEGQLVEDILTHADSNREWWVKQVIPGADGLAWAIREGRAKVSDLNHDKPADNLIRLSYTIRFVAKPSLTFL